MPEWVEDNNETEEKMEEDVEGMEDEEGMEDQEVEKMMEGWFGGEKKRWKGENCFREEGEGDVGDDGDEAEVADGDEAGEDEAEGAAAGHGVLPVHQVLGGRLHGGQVNHGGGWMAGAESAACRLQLAS